jgi:Domain of unknown function (DUF4365)
VIFDERVGDVSTMKSLPRKRRTREHIIADLSVNHLERQALLCGYLVERMVYDYGIDLELFTFTRKGEPEAGKILLQLKATDGLRIRPKQTIIPFRITRADLVHWLAQPMPVMLIVYDARKTIAYWLYIQSYFRKCTDFNLFTAGKTITVKIPIVNVVDPSTMRRFARFRNKLLDQMEKVIHEESDFV